MRSFSRIVTTSSAICCLAMIAGCSGKANVSNKDMNILTHKVAPAPMPSSARATIAAQMAAWQKNHAAAGQPSAAQSAPQTK